MKIYYMLALIATTVLVVEGGEGDDHDHHDAKSCACAAEEYGFAIDCDDGDTILATLPLLEANNCAEDCSSEACRTNFLIMQVHHDHCRHALVPDPVKDGIHFYEDACEECYILPGNDPSLPDCPDYSCTDGSGDAAYNNMLINGCLEDCTSAKCSADYKTLRLVHDLCDENAISPISETGIHDFEEICEDQRCNVGAQAPEDQLVCTDEPSDAVVWKESAIALFATSIPVIAMAV
mmetsp:Transcript_39006/g.94416  ORF Transcript_39006/g.94416 Transcript_39006/m.94416 type:complete len:236 (+) Transcript_39006:160-867(+)|eukprot:CAMPEP_0113471240 /NCGR_PEP_ID=MMETSP0014_2-20120614/16875_1 /TAXON_ID=2857 /ORGANISM="Nitzschia sp." /LENGTH=235 /DNA_ID=CAMNT_0000363867 /DNA_START=74 /DNA_END=781 /DNA_ORIENTATION=- /assembly_acc=CAM_ASM_000159